MYKMFERSIAGAGAWCVDFQVVMMGCSEQFECLAVIQTDTLFPLNTQWRQRLGSQLGCERDY